MREEFDHITEPWWDDRPTLLVGGGPSLRGRDLTKLRDHGRVVLINDAAKFIPGDVLFSADSRWIESRKTGDEHWTGYQEWEGEEIAFAITSLHPKATTRGKTPIRWHLRTYSDGMSKNPTQIAAGGNSGYAALNLAILKRAKLIYLLGYDMETGPHRHWHEGYASQKRMPNAHYYSGWAKSFERTAAWIKVRTRVINLNPKSAIACFEKGNYADLGL